MAETSLDVNAVLSILNKMDEEHRTYMSMFGARQHARTVIEAFKDASLLLNELQIRKKNLEDSITGLGKQLEDGIAKVQVEVKNRKDALEVENTSIEKSLTSARESYQVITKRLADKEAEASARFSELDSLLAAKEAELKKVTEAFETFKAEHGMR